MSARRLSWIQSKGGKCAKCGSTSQLEVDHIDRLSKEFSVSAVWSRSENIREAELGKCQVLCKECHAKKTYEDLYSHIPHGAYSKYRRGCRCVACVASVAPYHRDYRMRKKLKLQQQKLSE